MTVKPPIFSQGRDVLDHTWITKKYLDIPHSPLYVPQPEDLMRGLVAYYNDDGKSATTWLDMVNYPNGKNNGTIYGATTPPPATPQALGYLFDGVDDYVNAGNDASLNITNAITVNVWVKFTQAQGDKYFASKIDYGNNLNGDWGIKTDVATGTKASVGFNDGGWKIINGATVINDGKYHHVVGVISNGQIILYVDSNVEANGSIGNQITNSHNTVIGGTDTSLSPSFNGSIDEVRIYNRALSAQEINLLFQRQRGRFGI